jgi:hypothetical protein
MSIETADTARLRTLVAELDRLLASPAPLAATDPDGFPAHVASGELIESAWGNAVVDRLHRSHEVDAGFTTGTCPPITGPGAFDMQTVTLAVAPVACKTFVQIVVWAGNATVDMNVTADIVALSTGAVVYETPNPMRVTSTNSPYFPIPINCGWVVAAGAPTGFRVRINCKGIAAAGTMYASNAGTYRVHAS